MQFHRYICIFAYLHICIFAFVHICIFAFVHICIFADMQICIVVDRDAFAEEPDRGLPPPSGRAFPSSRDLWNCFSQTPPALLATKGARSLINRSLSPFSRQLFLQPQIICVQLLRVLLAALFSLILQRIFRQPRQKTEGIGYSCWQLRQSSAFYDSWDCINCVFIVPTFKSLNFLLLWKQIKMSTKEKESPLIRHAEAIFLAFKFNSWFFLVNTYWVVDLWEKMWLFKTPTCSLINITGIDDLIWFRNKTENSSSNLK